MNSRIALAGGVAALSVALLAGCGVIPTSQKILVAAVAGANGSVTISDASGTTQKSFTGRLYKTTFTEPFGAIVSVVVSGAGGSACLIANETSDTPYVEKRSTGDYAIASCAATVK